MDERQRVMRQRYREAFAEVRKVLNEADPGNMLRMGAPVDEYDPEVGDLVRLVLRDAPPTADETAAVWRRWFGNDRELTPAKVTTIPDALRVLHDHYASA